MGEGVNFILLKKEFYMFYPSEWNDSYVQKWIERSSLNYKMNLADSQSIHPEIPLYSRICNLDSMSNKFIAMLTEKVGGDLQSLGRVLRTSLEYEKFPKHAFFKKEGFFSRLSSSESWEEWTQDK